MSPLLLLVDDEPDLLKALCVRLRASGMTCETANNGQEALEKIKKQKPDLILLDLLMPIMDGYEFCRKVKANPQMASIPIMIVTAVPERAMSVSPEELGAAVIVHKPFDSHELLVIVQKVLSGEPMISRTSKESSSSS